MSARVAGVVLAAGASRRTGIAKATATLDGEPLVARIAGTLRDGGCSPVVVVVGPPHEEAVRAAAERAGARTIRNPDPDRGMLSSLQIALEALPPEIEAAVVALVDHPRVRAGTVRALLAAVGRAPRVRPTFEGRAGHPYLVARSLFEPLLALAPDTPDGARPVLRAADTQDVPVDDPAILDDLDTLDALRAAGIDVT